MTMRPTSPALVRLMAVLLLKQQVTGLLTDPFVENRGTVVLPAKENAANVSVFCQVTFQGTPAVTQWFLTLNGGTRSEVTSGSSIQLTGGTRQRNLTIVSFSRDLDMAILECNNVFASPNDETAFFLLRIIEPPVLSSEPAPMVVVENNVFSFNISQSLGYPPDPSQNSERATLTYQWFHDGVGINTTTSTNPNVSVYPEITFNPLVRTQSGNYSMTVSTEGEYSTGYFILDVHYLLAADVSGTQMYYGVEGGSVTLVAHVNITGRPIPGSVWMFNGATARGDAGVSGQLTITNLTPADSGNYTNTLTNTLSNGSIFNTVRLLVLCTAPPSEPINLNVTNIEPDTVSLSLTNPSFSGMPPFSLFIVELAEPSLVITRTVSLLVTGSSMDPSITNTLTVDRLQPNTSYSVRVRAVSTHSSLEDILGTWSSAVTFKTTSGDAPSKPTVLHVWSEILSASLTVQLYSGHSSTLSLTVFATNQAGIITVFVQSINVLSPNLKNYTLRVPLSPGVYRFTVKVNNSFGSTEKSNVYPPVGMDGIEVQIASHTNTGNINPTSTNAIAVISTRATVSNYAVGIGLGSVVAVSVVINGIQFVVIFLLSCLYLKKTSNYKQPSEGIAHSREVEYEAVTVVSTTDKQQNIELQPNAAYASIMPSGVGEDIH